MEISILAANASGALITGAAASAILRIRRVSDGLYLDWVSLTFKTGADCGVNISTAMDEVSATYLPGEYRKVVVITAWTDGFYQALVHFDDATTVLNFSGEKYIQGGVDYKSPATLAAADVSGNLPTDLVNWKGAAAPAMTGDAYAAVGTLSTHVDVNLDAKVSTRAPEALGNIAAILEDTAVIGALGAGLTAITGKTNLIPAVPASQADAQAVPAAVWAEGTRTLSSFGTLVADIAAAVWGAGTKVLTSFGTLVADTAAAVWGAGTKALTDKAGFTISGAKQTLDILHDATQGATATELTAVKDAIIAVLTAMKGTGWTTETLKAIKEAITAIQLVQIFEGLAVTMSADLLTVNIDGVATKLTLKQGEAKTLTLTVKDADGAAVNLSAATLTLGVKKAKSDTAYSITKADAAFGKTQAALGIVTVALTESDTDLDEDTYFGELKCSWAAGAVINKSADFYVQIKGAVIPVAAP